MQSSLAVWHYPHRTRPENIAFFLDNGFDTVSLVGWHVYLDTETVESGDRLAAALKERGKTCTVHATLPRNHTPDETRWFFSTLANIAFWQKRHGLISVLSLDVPQGVRDDVLPYLMYILQQVPNTRIAVEDFGLTADERAQIEPLKGNPLFGFLIDIGHMYLRLRGQNTRGATLFSNAPDECPVCEKPGVEEFLQAINTKEFPIFEMHLHNNDGVDDLHLFLEDGTLDIGMIAKVIKTLEFDGVMTIESAPGYHFACAGRDADEGILKTRDYWETLLKNA